MKPLTEEEIKFIKETGWTPTVQQADEWERTIFSNVFSLKNNYDSAEKRLTDRKAFGKRAFEEAFKCAKEQYGLNLRELNKKCLTEWDAITLENDAIYLFYAFFTKEELEKLTDKEATKWLKDFKYDCGYRKWDDGNLEYVQEAISVYEGKTSFYICTEDDSIWWFDYPAINTELFKKYEVK